MELTVTIDIFSGRPNPTITLKDNEARDLLERLQPGPRLTRTEQRGLPPSTLGYRGIVIEQRDTPALGLPKVFRTLGSGLYGPRLAHRAADEGFEDFLCGSAGPLGKFGLGAKFPPFLIDEIRRVRDLLERSPWKKPIFPVRLRCQCAPLYEPAWWNDGGQRQFNNNCYNYATNYRSDTFAQPGQAAGAMYTALTCASVRPAAIKDDLIDSPGAKNKCPKEGHLAALVIAPGSDFHWYRKGRNGYWTHKPGGTAATNLDNSGKLITDPRTADRGPYTDFCTFMVVMHGHVKIS
ncbi:MAG: hypothetical protein HYR72_26960 [Deltaproteobacteria bacterium]|nr:hypothetical protein [Deltaproteobacteria bacterium]MBI3390345.1 hypothetical protein [Deltaproteobacteria bacterium]